jgi:hypothetical protein
LRRLSDRWDIEHYPNFLRATYMSKSSWGRFSSKMEKKLLLASIGRRATNLTLSFTGSSVTAGHDCFYQQSFPVLVGRIMKPAFEPLGIQVVSRNVAVGNNPCMPYDPCVATFAGDDPDVVVWEQVLYCIDDCTSL